MPSFHILIFFFILPLAYSRDIQILNNCPFTTWVGLLDSGNPENGGYRLEHNESRRVEVDDSWLAGRIWARTGCDENMKCATGSCASHEKCSGTHPKSPVTIAEFTLKGASDLDYYDVSLLDGYNIPITIRAIGGTGDNCKTAGECKEDLNAICPDKFAVKYEGHTIACKSSCLVFDNDQECCRNSFANPEKCSQTQTSSLFKNACPGAFAYDFDDASTTFTCIGANYLVQFC